MSKNELNQFNKNELLILAKAYNITGRWDMSKDELINSIKAAKEKIKEKRDMTIKDGYIEKVNLGCLVAFKTSNGKVKSAKIVKRSIKERMLLLETEYKSVYKVSFDDVLWVKTGNRWPKGIYELLKGRVKLNEEEK